MLAGRIVLNPHDAGVQQVQAHAEHLGLDQVQVFRARRVGKGQTYLVVDWSRPVFGLAPHPGIVSKGYRSSAGLPYHAATTTSFPRPITTHDHGLP